MGMDQNLLAILLSFFIGLNFFLLWKIPFHYHSQRNSTQILLGGITAIFIAGYFSYAQSKLLLYFGNEMKEDLIFIKSDIWAFAFLGFLEGLFCFIPVAGWFDPNTYNSPLFQKKSTKGLILFTLIFITLPFYFSINAYTKFKEDQVEFVSYFNPLKENISYSSISDFRISSENRTSNSSKGQNRYYSILKLELTLKDHADYLILETEAPDDLLAKKTARLIAFLKERKIESQVPNVISGYSDWKRKLDYYLQRGK